MENMAKNEGRITVFISLITCALLSLILVTMQLVVFSVADSKTVIASRLAVSDIKSCYDSYIFEHYHILLFDKTMGGKGEAYLEEQLEDYFADKLGSNYEDSQVKLTSLSLLCDNECQAFKEQVEDYVVYALAEKGAQSGVDALREKTEGKDGTLPEELEKDMEDAEQNTNVTEVSEMEGMTEETVSATSEELEVDDPRDYTKSLTSSFVLNLVLPAEDKMVSDAVMEMEDLVSHRMPDGFFEYEEVDRKFKKMGNLRTGLTTLATWQDSLQSATSLPIYIESVFSSYAETKNDTAVLAYEQEYLIAGKKSDYENLKSVAHRMIGIRFPIDYVSLCGQTDKMAKVTELASGIAGAAPYLIPVLKYLLAGCWAYVEAIADVQVLFDGKKLAFEKTSENWKTDIDNLSESLSQQTTEDENGLDYQAYLTILQMMNQEEIWYRMLDLMQLNARQENPAFSIKHAAVGLEADFKTQYKDFDFYYHQAGMY